MELTPLEEEKIKAIYSDYHAGSLSPDEALCELELLINESED